MYALATGVSTDFSGHVIDIIQCAHVEKELNLPFGGLITKLALRAKVPLWNNEPNLKIVWTISTLTEVKSEAFLTKKWPQTTESASSPPEQIVPIYLVLEQINILSQKIDLITTKWEAGQAKLEQHIVVVSSDSIQANDYLVQLSLDVQQVMEHVIDFDAE